MIKESKQTVNTYFDALEKKVDRITHTVLLSSFAFGMGIAYFYDTYLIASIVGLANLAMFYVTKWVLPKSKLYQYVYSFCLSVFMAQFIYQMHGMTEMHFYAFIASVVLIAYQKWTVQLPLVLMVVIHHSVFAYLQYIGIKEIYFTIGDYMSLLTFSMHILFAAIIFGLCIFWSYSFRARTTANIIDAIKIQEQLDNSTQNTLFIKELLDGNFSSNYQAKENDEFGMYLLNVKTTLQEVDEKNKQDAFLNTGYVKMAELLRADANSLSDLCNHSLNFIVKYLNGCQGALFIYEEEEYSGESYLELKAAYAHEKNKLDAKRIALKEGLVGQCYENKKTIFLKNIPPDYSLINSGIGEGLPNTIVLVPIKTDQAMYGVIEVALFKKLETYQVHFLEKVAENLASAVANVKVTENMRQLLDVSQASGEQLQAQEEEMIQNLEELRATQEEMSRKSMEYVARIKELEAQLSGSV